MLSGNVSSIQGDESSPLLSTISPLYEAPLPIDLADFSQLTFDQQADLWIDTLRSRGIYKKSYAGEKALCFSVSAQLTLLASIGSLAFCIWATYVAFQPDALGALTNYRRSVIPGSNATCGEDFLLKRLLFEDEFGDVFLNKSQLGWKHCLHRDIHYKNQHDILTVLALSALLIDAILIFAPGLCVAFIFFTMTIDKLCEADSKIHTINDIKFDIRAKFISWATNAEINYTEEATVESIIAIIQNQKDYLHSPMYINSLKCKTKILKVIEQEKMNTNSYLYQFFSNHKADGQPVSSIGDAKNMGDLVFTYADLLPEASKAEVMALHRR